MSSESSPLESLPQEVFDEIIGYLDPPAAVNLSKSSSKILSKTSRCSNKIWFRILQGHRSYTFNRLPAQASYHYDNQLNYRRLAERDCNQVVATCDFCNTEIHLGKLRKFVSDLYKTTRTKLKYHAAICCKCCLEKDFVSKYNIADSHRALLANTNSRYEGNLNSAY